MALSGKGDSRWIVSERTDGTNVNAWHWTEKDVFTWVKDNSPRLKGLVLFKDEEKDTECVVKKITECSGEATACNRKGKVKCWFDFKLKLKFECPLKNEEGEITTVHGHILFSEICDDVKNAKYDAKITTESNNEDNKWVKSKVVENKSIACDAVAQLCADLQAHIPQPPPPSASPSPASTPKPIAFSPVPKTSSPPPATVEKKKKPFKTVRSKVHFTNNSCTELYLALTDASKVSAFTQSAAKFPVEAGEDAEFSFMDGAVFGNVSKLESHKKIEMKWQSKEWGVAAKPSNVVISIEEKDKGCCISVVQREVPREWYDKTKAGWDQLYWSRIKMVFGYTYSTL
eukprot:TRINITY_DN3373_c0_g2_i2.p1 TRINITY_DN3373_c0_g2~~TRINITY_DN3373_c0_g2_i2.p1  ORF type:complete len:344 (-),score=94.38 TRINITY_DN3373_c0_g2_i2:30-1061(-)